MLKEVGEEWECWNGPRKLKTLTVGAANTPYKSLIVPIFFVTLIVFGPAVTSATQTVLKASNVEQPKSSSSTETAMQILKWVPQRQTCLQVS